MIKLLTRKGMFCLVRGEQKQHRDIDKHLFGQRFQKLPDCRLAIEAIHSLKIRVDDPETDGNGTVPTSFDLCPRVGVFVCRKDSKDLLDLPIRCVTSIYPSHSYNRPSAHVMIAVTESTKACASRAASVPGTYRMSLAVVRSISAATGRHRSVALPPDTNVSHVEQRSALGPGETRIYN